MRCVTGGALGDFSAIYDDDVELVTVPSGLKGMALCSLSWGLRHEKCFSEQWVQSVGDTGASEKTLRSHLGAEVLEIVVKEIAVAVEVLGCLLDCSAVGVRLAAQGRPMCPRFHVDQVPCRLLLTFSGPGTEWIESDDVDFGILHNLAVDEVPIKDGRVVQQVDTATWSLLKGGAWDAGFEGVVHRSPSSSEFRLLLSLDPLFQ